MPERKQISTDEAARLLGISKAVFYRKIRMAQFALAPCPAGRPPLYWLDEVEELSDKLQRENEVASRDDLLSDPDAAT